jgi:uncharacterized membrane protein HdeD (DUF308 family)
MSQSVLTSNMTSPHDERLSMCRSWWVFLILGLVSVVVGLVAISAAFVTTLASVVVFGVLLLIAGFAEVIHAVIVRNLKGFALHLLAAALYLFVGLFMLRDPIRAAVVLTLLLAASFLVGGVLRIIFAIAVRFPAWPWVLLNGIVNLLLGIMIWNDWPEASLWVIGLFVGIDLLFHGWTWIILALSVRTLGKAV